MKYSELMKSEAKDSEILEFLIDGDTVPVTIRIISERIPTRMG